MDIILGASHSVPLGLICLPCNSPDIHGSPEPYLLIRFISQTFGSSALCMILAAWVCCIIVPVPFCRFLAFPLHYQNTRSANFMAHAWMFECNKVSDPSRHCRTRRTQMIFPEMPSVDGEGDLAVA